MRGKIRLRVLVFVLVRGVAVPSAGRVRSVPSALVCGVTARGGGTAGLGPWTVGSCSLPAVRGADLIHSFIHTGHDTHKCLTRDTP